MKSAPLLLVALFSTVATGASVTYDGDVFPEDVGWERVGSGYVLRTLEAGFLVQVGEEIGFLDGYRRSLTDFVGGETFFIEWRVETDAPSSLLDVSGTPVVVVLGGSGAAFYHTTITDSRVQLYRDTGIPLVYVDIEAGIPHTYRVELQGTASYAWYIDGELVDSGVPEGPYPTTDPQVIWSIRHYEIGNTTRWDYLKYGEIPEPGTVVLLLAGAACIAWRHRRSCG
ncbi:MAG: PEP-CTERM sorting domain-containing protein [Planctomycetes bacterium]|nr:PEP-CTERM sorting domain-containing protein [Planctomycetota bacterium]